MDLYAKITNGPCRIQDVHDYVLENYKKYSYLSNKTIYLSTVFTNIYRAIVTINGRLFKLVEKGVNECMRQAE